MWIKGSNYLGCLFLLVSSAWRIIGGMVDARRRHTLFTLNVHATHMMSAGSPAGGEGRGGAFRWARSGSGIIPGAGESGLTRSAAANRIGRSNRQFLCAHVSFAPHTDSGFSPDYHNVSDATVKKS
jgi:hypothetical protein